MDFKNERLMMFKEELIKGFFEKGYCCDLDEVKDTCLGLLKENQQLQEKIVYLERSNNRREDTILEQRQEISDLEDNWNKLKEIIKKKQDYYRHFKDNRYRKFLSELLDIMQEKEQGSDSNDSNR